MLWLKTTSYWCSVWIVASWFNPPALARVFPLNWRELVARAQGSVPDQSDQVEHPGDQGKTGEDQEAPDEHGPVLSFIEQTFEVGCRIAVATLLVEDAALAGDGTPPIARL